jgi:hypothetical protein
MTMIGAITAIAGMIMIGVVTTTAELERFGGRVAPTDRQGPARTGVSRSPAPPLRRGFHESLA